MWSLRIHNFMTYGLLEGTYDIVLLTLCSSTLDSSDSEPTSRNGVEDTRFAIRSHWIPISRTVGQTWIPVKKHL